MSLARHGTGPAATLRAFASQIHPVFMLPPLAASWFGAILAPDVAVHVGIVHALAIFFAVYTAHIKDGYVDFHRRGEDEDHPMTVRGCLAGLVGAAIGFAACLGYLWVAVGPGAVAVTAPTWFIGYLHAPQFDMNPVTVTLGYPVGIGLAIVGGQYVQAGAVSLTSVAFALVFVVVLSAVKIVDDEQDYEYDRSIGKPTVAVVLGRSSARALAYLLVALGVSMVLWFTTSGPFPPMAPLGAAAFAAVALLARRADPELATMLLVRGSYLLLAVLVAAVWFRPLAAAPFVDIGVLGEYTYLATEAVFGTIGLALLVRAGAVREAARTAIALYPLAYAWDWYTLAVGVFEIRLRTGIDLFAIPLEEHLFMFVVPALVIGIHENL